MRAWSILPLLIPLAAAAQDAGPPVDDAPPPVIAGPGFGGPPPVDDGDPTDDADADADGDTSPARRERAPRERAPASPRAIGDLAGGNVVQGLRIAPYGAGSGVDVGLNSVVGANGGARRALLRARYATGRFGVQVGLPFASYRVPRLPNEIGLGNLQLAGWYVARDDDRGFLAFGLEGHANVGEPTYTWANDSRELWPGYGASLVIQARKSYGAVTTMARGALGARAARDHAPFDAAHPHIELGLGADYAIGSRFGLVGETTFAWWDLAPWDAAVLGRADLGPGVRLRGGVIAPLGVWAGMSRLGDDFVGVREISLTADLSMSF